MRATAPGSSRTGREFMKCRRRWWTPSKRRPPRPLLRKLIEQNDPRYAPAAYILAVMLERKRILKVKEQIVRDGQRVFIYEQPKTGDMFTIADPDLRLDQLEAVQRDVAMLLEQGLNPPAAPVRPWQHGKSPPAENEILRRQRSKQRRPMRIKFRVRTCRTSKSPRLPIPRRKSAAPRAHASVRRA